MLEILNFLRIIILKISFASSLAISSYLDIQYWDSLIFISLLVNTSNILTYSKNFLGCL